MSFKYEDVKKIVDEMDKLTLEELYDKRNFHRLVQTKIESIIRDKEGRKPATFSVVEDEIFQYLKTVIVSDTKSYVKKQDIMELVRVWLKNNKKVYIKRGFLVKFKNYFKVREYLAYNEDKTRSRAFGGIRML